MISAVGIAAGELHRSMLYSIFGGAAFVCIFTEIYAFSSTIGFAVEEAINLDKLYLGLSSTISASHGLAVVSIMMAVRFAWRINSHFTHQDKLITAEMSRKVNIRVIIKSNN